MKIKEKGLTGKAAVLRKETMAQGKKGFNAFKEMAAANGKGKDSKGKEKAKPEVWLDFLGNRIRVYEEDGGTIKEEDVPYVKGASLKFEGVEGDVSFDEIKVSSSFHVRRKSSSNDAIIRYAGPSQRALPSLSLCAIL